MANHATKGRGKQSDGKLMEVPNKQRPEGGPLLLEVLPQSPSLPIGQKLQFTATVSDSEGSRDVSEDVFWKSSDPTLATIDGSGWATGVGEGTTEITARTTRGLKKSTELTVSPATLVTIAVTP